MTNLDAISIIVRIEALRAQIKALNMFERIHIRVIKAKTLLSDAEFHLENDELILAETYVNGAEAVFHSIGGAQLA